MVSHRRRGKPYCVNSSARVLATPSQKTQLAVTYMPVIFSLNMKSAGKVVPELYHDPVMGSEAQGPGTCGHHCLTASPCSSGSSSTEPPGPPARLRQPLVRTSCWVSALSSPIPGGPGCASSANTSGLIRPRDRNICLQKRRQQPFCNHS
ncbi:unnamed protein product [Rangifer tarandus platyrhynchus]|uniref:Uncharacterized protein n=1 Tax=Rangifer tarandus platyrhynchus TaxID=3082113 RepID=A0ABN8YVH6_RANTA|nr:unnamed protein product [Rangifer tarandus platyrhynchus]